MREGKLKTGSLLSGMGGFERALDKAEIPYEVAFYSEICPIRATAYSITSGVSEDKNLGDVTTATFTGEIDLLLMSLPFEDLQEGDEVTQSVLYCMDETSPTHVLGETLPHLDGFTGFREEVEKRGYKLSVAFLEDRLIFTSLMDFAPRSEDKRPLPDDSVGIWESKGFTKEENETTREGILDFFNPKPCNKTTPEYNAERNLKVMGENCVPVENIARTLMEADSW